MPIKQVAKLYVRNYVRIIDFLRDIAHKQKEQLYPDREQSYSSFADITTANPFSLCAHSFSRQLEIIIEHIKLALDAIHCE